MSKSLKVFTARARRFGNRALAASAFALAPVAAFAATSPVTTIKTKIESAGADWIVILVAIALVLWAGYGIGLLMRRK